MSALIHLIYSSSATHLWHEEDLVELLKKSRHNNSKLDITGMLLYENGSFFQVLEGPPENVDKLYDVISQDPRHTKTIVIIREPIAKRTFGEWTMGFSPIN